MPATDVWTRMWIRSFAGPRSQVVWCGTGQCHAHKFDALSLVLNQIPYSTVAGHRTTHMAALLASYRALSASSPRPDVSTVLSAVTTGTWLTLFAPRSNLTSLQHPSLTTQLARPSSLPWYQISGPANLAARVAGFITQVLVPPHSFDRCCDRTLPSQMPISLSRP
jgi:hypothetical protein